MILHIDNVIKLFLLKFTIFIFSYIFIYLLITKSNIFIFIILLTNISFIFNYHLNLLSYSIITIVITKYTKYLILKNKLTFICK